MAIVISRMDGTESRVVPKRPPELESNLADYIINNPRAIPVDEIKEGKELLVIAREIQTGSGPIDALAVDNEGDVYIVETKLYKNPDKRRVIGQVLDYGAALWMDPVFDRLNEAVIKWHGVKLNELIGREFSLNDDDIENLIDLIQRNFLDGSYKFMILMDVLDDRFKNLIMYMNQNTSFDIYGVEIEFYEFEHYQIAVPHIVGTEVRKGVKKPIDVREWDEESWFKWFEDQNGVHLTNVVREILHMALKLDFRAKYSTQRRDERATMWLFFDYEGNAHRILGIRNDRQVELRLSSLKSKAPFDASDTRLEFIKRMNEINGVKLRTGEKTINGNPTFSAEVFEQSENVNRLTGVLEWVAATIRNGTP